jgi:flagellar basal body rod protein FlgG
MFLNPAMSAALERITDRAADVRRAFTPGALPAHDDVATADPVADFTLDPLSVAPPQDTYFLTKDSRGEPAYTRDGSFVMRDGTLTGAQGAPILGIRSSGGDVVDLRIDPVDGALHRVNAARIEPDGSFVYERSAIDPRSGALGSQRVVVGRVALVRFPAGTRLPENDGDTLAAPTGVVPERGLPGDGAFSRLAPMRRERSRVNLDESLALLKEAYISFDALQAAEAAKGHLGKTAMDLLK